MVYTDDKIYNSNNYGPFKILEKMRIDGVSYFKIQFINTGTITLARHEAVMTGRVKDKYLKTIFNVACIGNASVYNPAHNIWRCMINRCYNINNKDYINYGGKGVTVCDKWLCFEYFLEDLPLIDGYDKWLANPSLYHLDKDYKQSNIPSHQKIYSVDTCCFISKHDNIALSDINSNKFIGLERFGDKIRVRCRVNGIRYFIGTFDNEIIAANAYNNFIKYMLGENATILNDVPYMSPDEVIKYNLKKNKEMCRIINQ